MTVSEETKIRDLIEAYPYLGDWLVDYAPEFKKLRNPVLYETVARAATLEAAASLAGVSVERLLDDIRTQIAQHEIASEEAGGGAAPVDDPERERRQESLKSIIRRLHDGASVDDVKAEFDAISAEVDSAEIAAMEQALIAEGMPPEEVQTLCDVHVSVFKETLEEEPDVHVEDGHPIAAYLSENEAAGEIVTAARRALDGLDSAGDEAARAAALDDLDRELERLGGIDVHYTRKENQLFPVLETRGVEGPTKVMWGLDDDIRARLKEARAAVASAGDAEDDAVGALSAELLETLGMVEDMVYKEEKILFPTALQVVSDEEWAAIAAGDAEIGYAWIETPPAWGTDATSKAGAASEAPDGTATFPLTTGRLSLEQLDILFQTIPFDLTYVDEDDRVLFYSEGERVFPRSPAVIGREVRNCHPPKSVDKVEAILAEFKAGSQDEAEFWIELSGRFAHIRYYALRDADGTYRGCLEVVQDATHVRSLTGERRLLDW